MIDQEHVFAIHDREVRNEMLRGNIWFPEATDFNAGIDPINNVGFGYSLKRIERLNALNFVSYHSIHGAEHRRLHAVLGNQQSNTDQQMSFLNR